jgi:hypothetical protein
MTRGDCRAPDELTYCWQKIRGEGNSQPATAHNAGNLR